MFKKAKSEKVTYGIIGLGRFGYALALELCNAGADIIALDLNEDKIREIREYTENAFVIKSLDKKSLSETGIQNCDVAIVCIGEHIDTSILTTLNLSSLGIKKIISKATSTEHGEILEKLGAEVVYPERDMATRLAHRLETSKVLDFVQLSERLNISKLALPDKLIGKTVIDANLRKNFSVNIIAVESDSKLIEAVSPDFEFKAGDIIFISGSKDKLSLFLEWAEK